MNNSKDNNIEFPIKFEPDSNFTKAALSMLTCCMQKVSIEMVSAGGSKATPSYFDKMAGIVMGLGETIYRIENNKIGDNDDQYSPNSEDLTITFLPEE